MWLVRRGEAARLALRSALIDLAGRVLPAKLFRAVGNRLRGILQGGLSDVRHRGSMRAQTRAGSEVGFLLSCFFSACLAENGAGVELLRAARRHAWLRRTRDT